MSETFAFVPDKILIAGLFLFIHCYDLPNAVAVVAVWPFENSSQLRIKAVWFITNFLSLCLHSMEIFLLIWPKFLNGIAINGLEVIALGMFVVFFVIFTQFLMIKS